MGNGSSDGPGLRRSSRKAPRKVTNIAAARANPKSRAAASRSKAQTVPKRDLVNCQAKLSKKVDEIKAVKHKMRRMEDFIKEHYGLMAEYKDSKFYENMRPKTNRAKVFDPVWGEYRSTSPRRNTPSPRRRSPSPVGWKRFSGSR